LLDPGRFLNRLLIDLILNLPRVRLPRLITVISIDHGNRVQRRWN
jgi:hypothetical protein